MGITAKQQRVFDKSQSIDKSHKEAVASHNKNVTSRSKRAKPKWTDKLKRTIKELYGGKNTYLPKGRSR